MPQAADRAADLAQLLWNTLSFPGRARAVLAAGPDGSTPAVALSAADIEDGIVTLVHPESAGEVAQLATLILQRCPTCDATEVAARCRCPHGDRRCPRGHWWRLVNGRPVPGNGHSSDA